MVSFLAQTLLTIQFQTALQQQNIQRHSSYPKRLEFQGLFRSSLKCLYLLHFLGCIQHGSDNHHSVQQVQWYSMRRHYILCASEGESKQKWINYCSEFSTLI